MDYKDTPEKKSSWKLRRRKEFRTKGVLALRLPAVLFGCLLALSYKPNFLNLPGAWENLILSVRSHFLDSFYPFCNKPSNLFHANLGYSQDWIQPYARYPELLKIGLNRVKAFYFYSLFGGGNHNIISVKKRVLKNLKIFGGNLRILDGRHVFFPVMIFKVLNFSRVSNP